MLQRSDGAGAERVAIHNRRVHLIGSNARKDRAATNIEMASVFQNAHGSFRGVETGAAFFKNLVTRSQSALKSRAIFTLTLRRHFVALNRPGAAVYYESDIWYSHGRRMVWSSFTTGLR